MRLLLIVVGVFLWGHGKGIELPSMSKDLRVSCTDCHMAYQAGLLPKRSWEKLFEQESLRDHFGTKVEMSSAVKKELMAYYLKYAADVDDNKNAKKIARSIKSSDTPLRPSKVRAIAKKHEDLDVVMIVDNPDVKYYGNCNACHGNKAVEGIFHERDVEIPNYKQTLFSGWSKVK